MKEYFHYISEDPEIVKAVREAFQKERDWGEKTRAFAERYGRVPVHSTGGGTVRFSYMTRKDDESSDPRAFAKTEWVMEPRNGYLRPRANHPVGKKILAEMEALGSCPSPTKALNRRGIPMFYDMLSTPGLWIPIPEGEEGPTMVIATYGTEVKHDKRWRLLKQSEYWALRESEDAKKAKKKVK